jgi:hypothetical protein
LAEVSGTNYQHLRWVPYTLTASQKVLCCELAQRMLQAPSKHIHGKLDFLFPGDKSWMFDRDEGSVVVESFLRVSCKGFLRNGSGGHRLVAKLDENTWNEHYKMIYLLSQELQQLRRVWVNTEHFVSFDELSKSHRNGMRHPERTPKTRRMPRQGANYAGSKSHN